jgi:hypothetical protein
MAGSWGHITDDQGRFTGADLIDNLGDAYEALAECYGMVVLLADDLALARQGGSWTVHTVAAERRRLIESACERYKEGLAIGAATDGGE